MQRSLCFLCLFLLNQLFGSCISSPYSLYISEFDYKVFYVGVENVIPFTLRNYPFKEQERDPLPHITMYVNNVSSNICVIDRLYKEIGSAKVTCTFSYNAFDPTAKNSMETYVVLTSLSGQVFTSQTYWEGQLLDAKGESMMFAPNILVMKKGAKFFLVLPRKAVIDISRLEAKLGMNELRIISYQGGAFYQELVEDDFSDQNIRHVYIYDKEDVNRRFFHNGFINSMEIIIPETEAYLIGFDNWPFAEDQTLRVKGKIEGNPSVVQVYGLDGKFMGTASIIEVHPEYIIIENNDVIRSINSAYLMLEGHGGKVSLAFLSNQVNIRVLQPYACEAGTVCTISVSPPLPYMYPYTLSALDSNGSVMNITYQDISTTYEYNVQYIRDFPSNFSSILTFSVDNIPRITSSTELISIPSGEVLFTGVQPRPITVQVQQPLPSVSVYGAGMDHLAFDLEMLFRPKVGPNTVMLKMKKIRDSTGMLVYTRILTDEDCLPAYACYESLHAVYPISLLPSGHSADILFRPVEPTGEQHRVYFEIYIRHPTVDTLLQMMKDMSMFTLECMNAQFSQFKTVNSTGGTWVDVSVTNSNEQCIITLTKGFYDTRSKLYKLLSLTGRSSGAHSQVECDKLTPVIFRRDCDIPDKDYFIPIPPENNAVDNSSPKVNEHNYTIIFISLFIGIVGATAAGWYFCKYRKDKLKKNTRDVYNRM